MTTLEKGLLRTRARAAALRAVEDGTDHRQHGQGDGGDVLAIERLPTARLSPKLLTRNRIVTDELSGASAAYKMLRTRVLQRMRHNGWRTLAVTGTCPDEGKSLTAVNLSISLARDLGTSVVLVDMDLRKPAIHRHLGFKPRYGLNDYLCGAAALEEVAVRVGIDRLGIIANERSIPNSSEMLTSPQAINLIERTQQGEGRIVVLDLPPVLVSDDMLALCPFVDAVLLVVAQGVTRQADLRATRDLLQDVSVVGVVLNRSSEDVAPYYYYGHR